MWGARFPWDASGLVSQMIGTPMGLGAQQQDVDCAQQASRAGMMYNYPQGNYIPITTVPEGTCDTLYIANENGDVAWETESGSVKVEEPPDEFTQLSNHKFHELLDRFSEST